MAKHTRSKIKLKLEQSHCFVVTYWRRVRTQPFVFTSCRMHAASYHFWKLGNLEPPFESKDAWILDTSWSHPKNVYLLDMMRWAFWRPIVVCQTTQLFVTKAFLIVSFLFVNCEYNNVWMLQPKPKALYCSINLMHYFGLMMKPSLGIWSSTISELSSQSFVYMWTTTAEGSWGAGTRSLQEPELADLIRRVGPNE